MKKEENDLKKRRSEAAKKAWRTIRSRRREKESESTKNLLDVGLVKVSEPKLVSIRTDYGRGIIHQFDKTPSSIACGPFWELRWAFGCPFNCAYCYLRGTMRGKMQPRYVDIKHVLAALDEAFSDDSFNSGKPAIFNTGELADSWMNPTNMIQIIDKFEEQKKHRVLILTKFGYKNPMVNLLREKLRQQTIVAFSINAEAVAKQYEESAHSPSERIEAASILSKAGYETRIRIDPIFPMKNWERHYDEIIRSILSKFEPDRIILGTPRGLRKTILFAQNAGLDISWIDYLDSKETGWGLKLPFSQRKSIYRFFYDRLHILGYDKSKISMCKETTEMWKEMKLPFTPLVCNCYSR